MSDIYIGENIKLEAIDSKAKTRIKSGKSTQETREGYNILNVPSVLNITSEEVNRLVDINIDADTNYTIKADKIETDNTEATEMLFGFIDSDNADISYVYINLTDKHQTFSLNKKAVKVRIYSSNGHNTSAETNTTFINLMIYKGTDLTKPYEPYGVMPSPDYPSEIKNIDGNIGFKVEGKNRFDINSWYDNLEIPSTINAIIDNSIITFQGTENQNNYFKSIQNWNLKPNTKYTISIDCQTEISGANYAYFNLANASGHDNQYYGVLSPLMTRSILTKTFITDSEGNFYLKGYVNYPNHSANRLIIYSIQLEEGTEATDYEPYKSQVVTFPLGEEKLMEGSYLADDGIHHKKKQIVLDGTEGYINQAQGVDSIFYTAFKVQDMRENSELLCSHFRNSKNIEDVKMNIGIGALYENYIYFGIDVETIGATADMTLAQKAEKWKSYLAEQKANGTPIVIEYYLAEEEIEPYTTEQQEAYDRMQNIILYNGINYIDTINEIKPTLEVKVSKIVEDYDAYISSNGYLIIPEYNIKYLVNLSESDIPTMPEASEASARIAGRDGDIPLKTTYEPIKFNLVCYTEDNLSIEEKDLEENNINRFLHSIKEHTKRFALEKRKDFYDVKYSGAMTTINYPKHLQFNIPLKSSASYGKDWVQKEIIGNNSLESETIEATGAVFTIKGPAQTPTISFNDYIMEYTNVLLEGQKLIIDSRKSTITHINSNGIKTNVMQYYNHQFPKVEYGINTLKILSGIDSEEQVDVKWYDLKL